MSCYLMTYDEKMSEKKLRSVLNTALPEMKCLLKGYRLVFYKFDNKAGLSLEKCEGAGAPVVIWRINTIDAAEFDKLYPENVYERKVFLLKAEGIALPVFGYTAKKNSIGLPEHNYLDQIAAAYEEHNFDFTYIEEAMDRAADQLKEGEV